MSDLSDVPVIDIGPCLAGSQQGNASVAAQVKQACEEIGFFTIVGHRVPQELIESTRRVSNAFFDLPVVEKLKIKRPPLAAAYGYAGLSESALGRSLDVETPPDYQEALSIGAEVPPDDPYYRTERAKQYFPANQWPERPTDLREIYLRYYSAMEKLGIEMMRIFARALDLPEEFFDKKVDRSVNSLRVVRYPAQTVPPV